MAQACEVCGSKLHAPTSRVEIDGAVMSVCSNCARLGRPVGPVASPPRAVRPMPSGPRPMQPAFRPVTGSRPQDRPAEGEYEVDPDYNLKIRQAREKMGLSQEDLGMHTNEKLSVIRLLESKKLQPDMVLTRKLMHFLKINLLVSTSDLDNTPR